MWAALGLFLVLHGLVHLLYAGHSMRLFELRPGLTWPDGSWAFSRLLGVKTTRLLACAGLILVTLGFLAGGLGCLLQEDWWSAVTAGSAVFSSVILILLWDRKWHALADQGGVGVQINLAVLVVIQVLL
jgi:hypothetical protein